MSIKGAMLRDAILSGANNIINNKKAVDQLNVFPVPDGDTGTNMSMTMENSLLELKALTDDVAVSKVASTAAAAMLRGARGNSGVILSLLFRGISKGLKEKDELTTEDFASALAIGVQSAYKAVMKPTEGTILTVARLMSEKATEICVSVTDFPEFFSQLVVEGNEALAQTPELLPVLKKAGVVDSGGKGLMVIFEGMESVFSGKGAITSADKEEYVPVGDEEENEAFNAAGEYEGEITYTYCTEFIVIKDEEKKSALSLRAFLETIGDCVVVVDDDEIIKIHVHTDHPGQAFEEGLKYGMLNKMKVENMRLQHEAQQREVELKKNKEIEFAEAEKKYGFVAVAAGEGLEELFKELGADKIVTGGQTMNPSTQDILKAIHATPSEIVFVLPNNKNIIMAAEQAVKLAKKQVCVLQTRTIPQGIAAMLAFDPEGKFKDNRLNMTKAIDNVQTGSLTFAARDSEYDGHEIKKGEIMAMANGKLTYVESDLEKATVKLVLKMAKRTSSFITLFYGEGVTEQQAKKTAELIRAKLPDSIDVNVANGGQPVYYYLISIE